MFQNIGGLELVIIAVVLMILFGAKRVPEFARSLRVSGQEFKKALKDDASDKKTKLQA